MGRKKKVVTAKVPVGDEGATQPEKEENLSTNPNPEEAATKVPPEPKPEETPAPEGAEEENLAKMVAGSPTIAGKSSTEDQQLEGVAEDRLPGVIETAAEKDEPEEEETTFKTISRSLEELPLGSIQHFNLIPDFVIPTVAAHPIIIRTTEGNYCIDGWELVEAARSEGKPSILCEVDELNTHSDEEICLRKGGIRSLTRGGISTYPEMIRNTGDLLAMLLSSDEDLRTYGQGERRYGQGFVGNREEDVRHILAMRLGRDRDTVNLYLCHGEYLSSDALQFLIDHEAPKEFFVKVQSKKRIELKNQKGRNNLSTGRITAAISTFMLGEFEKFLANRDAGRTGQTPEPAPLQPAEPPEDPTPADDDDTNDDEYPAAEEDTENPISESTPEEAITIETIKTTTLGVGERLVGYARRDIPLVEIERSLRAELDNIMRLLNQIARLNNSGK